MVDVDVSEDPRSADDTDSRASLASVAVGLLEVGADSLRATLGRGIPGEWLLDVTLGAALAVSETASRAVGTVRGLTGFRTAGLLRPPTLALLPANWAAVRIVEDLRQRGRQERLDDRHIVEDVLDVLVPLIVEEVVRRIDLDVLVQEYLDVPRIVAGLDVDAIVDSVDVDRVADRLDVGAVLDRLDLNTVVRDRVDVDAIVQAVDIDAVAARLDLDAIIERLNLPGVAQRVIDEIDLPRIIRESTGSMASETVRGVRMHSIEADDAVGRALGRVFHHRQSAPTAAASATAVEFPAAQIDVNIPAKVQPSSPSAP
jgi:hypothetical protein